MGDSSAGWRSRRAWELARRQHGVLAHSDLIRLGFSAKAIKHRVRIGRLHPVFRGVYAVGRPHLNREGRWMAAILACGPGAALSHRSAAALWGFGKESEDYIDVSVRRDSEARIRGVRCHRRPTLSPSAITTRLNIPLTQPVQTFLDLAAVTGPKALSARSTRRTSETLSTPMPSAGPSTPTRVTPASGLSAASSTSTPSASPTTNSNSSSARSPQRPDFPPH